MKVRVIKSGIKYDASELRIGMTIDMDELTAMKLIQRGYTEEVSEEITNAKLEEKTKKAIRRSTKKNG